MFIDRKSTEQERKEARRIAAAVLNGELTVLAGARALFHFAHTDAIQNEDDRRLLIVIESETDTLPIGAVRKLWAEDALHEKDIDIAHCETLWKDRLFSACQ